MYRYARLQGLSASDADEVAADVLRRVVAAATRWAKERPSEHFAAWLRRVARNSLLNLVTRELARRGTGGTSNLRMLSERPGPTADDHQQWETQRQKALLRRAAAKMRQHFDPTTCEAFWQTHVQGREVADVAAQLGKSAGAVCAIRRRMVRWLRDEVQRLESMESGNE